MKNCNLIEACAQARGDEDLGPYDRAIERPERFAWIDRLVGPGQIVELWACKVRRDGSDNRVNLHGYFDADHRDKLIEAAAWLSGRAEGVYWTPNPIDSAIVSGPLNQIRRCVERTRDQDIAGRRWLMIDLDAVKKVKGASATDAEQAAVKTLAERVWQFLAERGFPAPVVCRSGNGSRLLYAIDEPAEDGGLVRRVLGALAKRFDGHEGTIDLSMANAARLDRFYGTMVCKGENTPERQHRESAVLEIPAELQPVPHELLVVLAAEAPANERAVAQPMGDTVARRTGPASEETVRRVKAYLPTVDKAESGQGGHNRTMYLAGKLVNGFGLSADEAYPFLAEWNETLDEKWTPKEMWHKLHDAETEGDPQGRPRGYLLEPDRSHSGVVVETAMPPQTDSNPDRPIDDPDRLASAFLAATYQKADGLRLLYWHEGWWQWADGFYRRLPSKDLRVELGRAIRQRLDADGPAGIRIKVTGALIDNTLQALGRSCCWVPPNVAQPAWLGASEFAPANNVVAVRNGLLNLSAIDAAARLRPPSPEWFSPICLPVDYHPDATCPLWLKFLDRNLEGDAERTALLQEWFGYCLVQDTTRQSFLMLQGEGCNGKSVVCGALTALLGGRNVSHVPLDGFGERFALFQTLGKLANIVGETGEVTRANEGKLKLFTDGGGMMFERKGVDPVEAPATARLVVATNNPPRFKDKSNGLSRRLILMPLLVQIPDAEKVPGMDQPKWWAQNGELPGMLNWALEGWARLTRQNGFTRSAVCEQAKADYRAENNPAGTFLAEYCEAAPEGVVGCDELYTRYKEWKIGNGHEPMSSTSFGKEVARAFPARTKGKREGAYARENTYVRIRYTGPLRFHFDR